MAQLFSSPLVDLLRSGRMARDAKLLGAKGALAPDAREQMALLVLLADDEDAEVAGRARATIDALPADAVRAFLSRPDVPPEVRAYFDARHADGQPDAPAESPEGEPKTGEEPDGEAQILSSLPVAERMKLAMKGTREQRAQLIRDPNRMVAAAVLTSPKLTEAEIESFVRMGNVSEEVLRTIGTNRTWRKNYAIVLGLVRNPKTPPGISMQLLHRLTERDIKAVAVDRNVPEALRMAARKAVVKAMK